MLLMEAFSTLQRQNQKLQTQILSMEDVSDRLQQLEEFNRKLHKVIPSMLTAVLLLIGFGQRRYAACLQELMPHPDLVDHE